MNIPWPTKAFRAMRAQQWRDVGRALAMQGEVERSRLCHELADLWGHGFWPVFWGSWHGITLIKRLDKLKEQRRESKSKE